MEEEEKERTGGKFFSLVAGETREGGEEADGARSPTPFPSSSLQTHSSTPATTTTTSSHLKGVGVAFKFLSNMALEPSQKVGETLWLIFGQILQPFLLWGYCPLLSVLRSASDFL